FPFSFPPPLHFSFFFLLHRPPPRSTLFPYTTLFRSSAFSLCVSVELMGFHSYIVAAGFHTRVDAIEAMKQVVAEVTAPSLDEDGDRKSTRLNSSHDQISYAVFCLKKKKKKRRRYKKY